MLPFPIQIFYNMIYYTGWLWKCPYYFQYIFCTPGFFWFFDRFLFIYRSIQTNIPEIYRIFRFSSQIFKMLLTVPSHFGGILLSK